MFGVLSGSKLRQDWFRNVRAADSRSMFLSFMRFVPFIQDVFQSGSEVGLNIMLLKVGFHSVCRSAGPGGQPADRMELLAVPALQTKSKFNLTRISLRPVVFKRLCRSTSQG